MSFDDAQVKRIVSYLVRSRNYPPGYEHDDSWFSRPWFSKLVTYEREDVYFSSMKVNCVDIW